MVKKWNFFWMGSIIAAALVGSNTCANSEGIKESDRNAIARKVVTLQIPFITNQGQMDEQVKYYASTFGGTVFITKHGEIVYSLPKKTEEEKSYHGKYEGIGYAGKKNPAQNSHETTKTLALKETLVSGKTNSIRGEGEAVTQVSYFQGNDPSKWKSNITTYKEVCMGEVYKGIELRLRAYGNNVEKLFFVKPDVNPDQIQLRLDGAESIRINNAGQLEAKTELGIVKFTMPVAYQEIDGKRVNVSVKYVISECEGISPQNTRKNPKTSFGRPLAYFRGLSEIINPQSDTDNRHHKQFQPADMECRHDSRYTYGFKVASYDTSKELIIDPLLASTFIGGTSEDDGYSLAIDAGGNVYVTGKTTSSAFPTTTGVFDTTLSSGTYDAFVAKFNGGLTSLLASTFLGSSNDDAGYALAIDVAGNVFVMGMTNSTTFPTTIAAYDTTLNGGYDIFIAKFNSGLTSLLASTYLGGSSDEVGNINSFTLDAGGNVYVAGATFSSAFPTTLGIFDSTYGGSGDAFVSKFNNGLTSLLASTFLGSTAEDSAFSLAIDAAGNVFVAGSTSSTLFPVTTGAFDTTHNGINDVFVSKFNSSLTNLLASTFLGGSNTEICYSIKSDIWGNVFLTGLTDSTNFPTAVGAYDRTYNGGTGSMYDAFVSKFNNGLNSLMGSTFLGGVTDDRGISLATDAGGNVYVAGRTNSPNFPATSDAYSASYNGDLSDAFISKLNSSLTGLLASTFLGGSGFESCNSIALNKGGDLYVTSFTNSTNFPTTTGAYDTTYGGNYDAFIARLDNNLSQNVWDIASVGGNLSEGQFTSLSLDSSNKPNISYYEYSNHDLKTATNASGSWATSKPDTTGRIGRYTSTAIKNSNGRFYISYYDQTNGNLKLATNDTTGGTWTTVAIDTVGNVGLYTSIAINSAGRVYISYYDATNKDLKCAYSSTPLTSWTITTIDSTGDVGLYTSIAIDSIDNVHISYYDRTNSSLKYVLNSFGVWSTELIDDDSWWDIGQYSSIAVDSFDNVHISYYGGGSLWYANNINGSWQIEEIDGGAYSVGLYSSIAIDQFDNVHISYYDQSNRDLKYANNTELGAWKKFIVDGAGRVGEFTAIKVDKNGFVHIGYYDRSNTDLKYARSLKPYGIANYKPQVLSRSKASKTN